jgi:di/tricarboxylate transporter
LELASFALSVIAPNVLFFDSVYFKTLEMVKAGIWRDIISIIVINNYGLFFYIPTFGVQYI